MAYNSRLDSILRALHNPTPSTTSEISRLYATSAAVLATLTNPLNVTLLTTQILTAPAIWNAADLRTSLGVYGAFVSATLGKIDGLDVVLELEEWLGAVVMGANNNVPRWKHLLVIGAILTAFKQQGFLPRNTRRSLENAFVKATNMSLENPKATELESDTVSLILSRVLFMLSSRAKAELNHDALVEVLVRSIYTSSEGFQSGYFLSKIDLDVMVVNNQFSWPRLSNSFLELQTRSGRPLFTSINTLARIVATSIISCTNVETIEVFLNRILEFSTTLSAQWKMNKLSDVDALEEEEKIDAESRKFTMPVVWQILKTILFTTTLITYELINKLLVNPELCRPEYSGVIANKTLAVFQRLYFITSRMGHSAFSTYNFVNLACIDILTAHPDQLEHFAYAIAPQQPGTIPTSHMDRTLDLFFLNTAEHFPASLPAPVIESLLFPAATPYLTPPASKILQPHFEAAHSLMLSILSSPKTPLTLSTSLLPFYADAVLSAFPEALTSKQFLIATSTLIRISSPPHQLAEQGFVQVLLELISARAQTATLGKGAVKDEDGLNEKDVLVSALVKALPVLEVCVMRSWLWDVADRVRSLTGPGKENVRERFWETLAREMDVERAEVGVRWWLEEGGREYVFGIGERREARI